MIPLPRYKIYNISGAHRHVIDTMYFNEANFFWNLGDAYAVFIDTGTKYIQFVGTPVYQTLPKSLRKQS